MELSHEQVIALLSALLLLSEALGGIKSVADNSIYQMVMRGLKSVFTMVGGKVDDKGEPIVVECSNA